MTKTGPRIQKTDQENLPEISDSSQYFRWKPTENPVIGHRGPSRMEKGPTWGGQEEKDHFDSFYKVFGDRDKAVWAESGQS